MARIVDQRHYLDVLDPVIAAQIPPQAKRIAEFFAAIVQGVTGGWDDPADGCALTVRCINRIGRRRCTDRVVACVTPSGDIKWICLRCREEGTIQHWQETPWNLTGKGAEFFPTMDVVVELEMSADEFDAVASIPVLDGEANRVLAATRLVDGDLFVITAPRSWLNHLIEFIASEANHSRSKKKVALYEAVLDRADI